MNSIPREILRESEIVGTLENICQALELTPTQHDAAKGHYEAVAGWLGESGSVLLKALTIYPHGSVALGTTVKPHGRLEHDVDLVSRAVGTSLHTAPSVLKDAIGARLREHSYYRSILEEKRRCWRLNYADEFHLDITPSIFNPACSKGGELVPDKELRQWKATNPQGYRTWFENLAKRQPRILLSKALTEDRAFADRADVAPYPLQMRMKGVLRRTVQLSKRHRDIWFEHDSDGVAPISIIITTALAQAYEICVGRTYDSELRLILDIIRLMPSQIAGPKTNGDRIWTIWNPTTGGENFAEKWNVDAALPAAFFGWHKKLASDVENMTSIFGFDQLKKSLSESFGPHPVNRAMDAVTQSVSTARAAGSLHLVPKIGLSAAVATRSTTVRSNTFFGAD
jgi:hypothetical protein